MKPRLHEAPGFFVLFFFLSLGCLMTDKEQDIRSNAATARPLSLVRLAEI